MINLIYLYEVGSTNTELTAMAADGAPHGTVVAAHAQKAGRGQRGNSWEAQPGKNLTFSLLLRPDGIDAADQFAISEAVALGIADALHPLVPAGAGEVAVKWPNDIYVGDSKICGILIENSLSGRAIAHSIAGIGINVNQREFVSDAPNPVSLLQLDPAHGDYQLKPLLEEVTRRILARYATIGSPSLHADYMASLWRRDENRYRDTATGETFTARIADVAPTGHITLETTAMERRTYAFKEVSTRLPDNSYR